MFDKIIFFPQVILVLVIIYLKLQLLLAVYGIKMYKNQYCFPAIHLTRGCSEVIVYVRSYVEVIVIIFAF